MQITVTPLEEELHCKIDFKTKPPGSLGLLESIALQAGRIQNTLSPQITAPHILIFAADHGIAATGLVNPYPQSVTAQMVLNFISGGAAINVFCRQHKIDLTIIDSGVNHDFGNTHTFPQFIDAKISFGTQNYLYGNAMTEDEVMIAVAKGRDIVKRLAASGCNTVGFGEMGIGNTSSASLIMTSLLQIPVEDCTGRGTGTTDEQLQLKIETLKKTYQFHRLDLIDGNAILLLSKIGGLEIAMMTGAYLEAATQGMIIMVDGFISTAALLIAHNMNKNVLANCIFAHTSGEKGHKVMLNHLNAKPLLQLGLRLGEGTGAALAIPLVQSAVNFLNDMASFESAGVSNKEA